MKDKVMNESKFMRKKKNKQERECLGKNSRKLSEEKDNKEEGKKMLEEKKQ